MWLHRIGYQLICLKRSMGELQDEALTHCEVYNTAELGITVRSTWPAGVSVRHEQFSALAL
jgi:hypothetical protein